MHTPYEQLKSDNIRRYGEDIGRIGPMLLAKRYDNRAHFIFELLQNAEDALRRHPRHNQHGAVLFDLSKNALQFSHFGHPFTETDVQFICGIGESTSEHQITEIGHFGIGFKSVYTFTDAPEIHSGDEHFAIDSFVWPRSIEAAPTQPGETIFRFPFRPTDETAPGDVARGLADLGPEALLFLRHIDKVEWHVEEGDSGTYLRVIKAHDVNPRLITLLSQRTPESIGTEEHYLVFSRFVFLQGAPAGQVEIAFRVDSVLPTRILPVRNASLSAFFPTIVPTGFGAILQGPYRTTPSRDNIPRDDPWNQHLIAETAVLLAECLSHLRDFGILDASALNALPILKANFPQGSLFQPIYIAVAHALKVHDLLPCEGDVYQPAGQTRLGRTKEIRDLLSPSQLAQHLGAATPTHWISGEVTRDRLTMVRTYLIDELGISEMDPEAFVNRVSESFLEAQSNSWIAKFYAFLSERETLWKRDSLLRKALIRLHDGTHVVPFENGHPRAFLPGASPSGFPTVHPEIVAVPEALDFLSKIGLSAPDPVDEIRDDLLPKYKSKGYLPSEQDYARDIARLLSVARVDLKKSQRDKLIDALRDTPFLAVLDAGTGVRSFVEPGQAYSATDRLKALFAGVSGVPILDSDFGGLRGKDLHNLLESCGCAEYLAPETVVTQFDQEELKKMRMAAGTVNNTGCERIDDRTLRGLDALLDHFSSFSPEQISERSRLLWEALCDVEERRGTGLFSGTYSWFYTKSRSCQFDAAFVRRLRASNWVPGRDNVALGPRSIVFESLNPPWKENVFLRSCIQFKPALEIELANQAGIEPGVLDLLRKLGLTSEAELKHRLGITAASLLPQNRTKASSDVSNRLGDDAGEEPIQVSGGHKPEPEDEGVPSGGGETGSRNGGGLVEGGHGSRPINSSSTRPGRTPTAEQFPRVFHTYVAASPDEELDDSEGLEKGERLEVERVAIEFILHAEPSLKMTPLNNPGFDLYEGESLQSPSRFIEVKSKRGPWTSPVGLSSVQFRKASEQGERFWLYVVENVGEASKTRLHCIQDPAGKSHFFTFDDGWVHLATPPRCAVL